MWLINFINCSEQLVVVKLANSHTINHRLVVWQIYRYQILAPQPTQPHTQPESRQSGREGDIFLNLIKSIRFLIVA
tara:strand:+ start:481 stop:708 length:228 start_codon:yes stop_codon:yes gene_type:complete